MADEEIIIDENSKVVKSGAAKWLSPMPDAVDLTRVKTGPAETDYEYADPGSLFAMERLVASMPPGKFVKAQARGFKKFVRELAEKAYPYWPAEGYVRRMTVDPGPVVPPRPVVDETTDWPEPDLVDDSEHQDDPAEASYPVVDEVPPLEPLVPPPPAFGLNVS